MRYRKDFIAVSNMETLGDIYIHRPRIRTLACRLNINLHDLANT